MLEVLEPCYFGWYYVGVRRFRVVNKIFSIQYVKRKPLFFKRHITGVRHIAGSVQTENAPVVFAHLDDISRIAEG